MHKRYRCTSIWSLYIGKTIYVSINKKQRNMPDDILNSMKVEFFLKT